MGLTAAVAGAVLAMLTAALSPEGTIAAGTTSLSEADPPPGNRGGVFEISFEQTEFRGLETVNSRSMFRYPERFRAPGVALRWESAPRRLGGDWRVGVSAAALMKSTRVDGGIPGELTLFGGALLGGLTYEMTPDVFGGFRKVLIPTAGAGLGARLLRQSGGRDGHAANEAIGFYWVSAGLRHPLHWLSMGDSGLSASFRLEMPWGAEPLDGGARSWTLGLYSAI